MRFPNVFYKQATAGSGKLWQTRTGHLRFAKGQQRQAAKSRQAATGRAQLFIAAALVIALAVGSGCQRGQSPVQVATEQGILLKGNGAEPQTLDPQFATGVPEAQIITALYEGLVTPEPQTLKPRPGVAERWEVSADGLHYTFHLREDAKWSNGEPLTADDFVFAYRRALNPRLGAQNAFMLFALKNAEAYHNGQLSDFAAVGAKVQDAHTLVLTLEYPTPFFLSLIQHIAWLPLYEPLLKAHNAVDTRSSQWMRPESLVSNGPFRLASWNVAEELSVESNPHYHSPEAVGLNGIRFYPISNLNTEERAFRSGQLHMTNGLPLPKYHRYRSTSPQMLYNHTYLGSYYYLFNSSRPPFNDPRVRRALALTVDRNSIANHVLGAGQLPAASLVPPGTSGHQSGAALNGNLEEARRLLAEAGYPEGENFPAVSLLYNTSENHRLVAEAVQRMWLEQLGIHVTLVNQDWKVYLEARQRGDFDIARGSWIGDYNDPTTFLNQFATSGAGWSRWHNDRYDSLLNDARAEADLDKRAATLREAEQVLLDEAALVPLYFYVSNYLVSPEVKGWHPNVLDIHPYAAVRLESGPQPHPATTPARATAAQASAAKTANPANTEAGQ